MKNNYMGFTEIMTVLLNLDYTDTIRAKQLFASIESGDFYTKYGSVTEMTQNDGLKKLAVDLFTYYTADKRKAEKEFYKNIQTLIGALYDNNPNDVKELLLQALSVSDEKKRYDLLKQIFTAIKDEKAKNNICLSIIGHSCATLIDYNIFLKRWTQNEYKSLNYKQASKIITKWITMIKQFVFKQDYEPKYFDSVFQEINAIVVKLASFYPDIAKNIRYVCQIQPSVVYKQEQFKNIYSGAEAVLSNITKEFLIMREHTEELNKELSSLKDNVQPQSARIKELETENERLRRDYQRLREEHQKQKEENQKLKEENRNLKSNLESTNSLFERLKKSQEKPR